jgi:hypothetical protein
VHGWGSLVDVVVVVVAVVVVGGPVRNRLVW